MQQGEVVDPGCLGCARKLLLFGDVGVWVRLEEVEPALVVEPKVDSYASVGAEPPADAPRDPRDAPLHLDADLNPPDDDLTLVVVKVL